MEEDGEPHLTADISRNLLKYKEASERGQTILINILITEQFRLRIGRKKSHLKTMKQSQFLETKYDSFSWFAMVLG